MDNRQAKTLAAAALLFAGMGARPADAAPAPRQVTIVVDGDYTPNRVEVPAGEPVTLVFDRRDSGPCTQEVVLPKLNVRRALRSQQQVAITLPALAPGVYEWRCGMNMVTGTIAVTAKR